MKKLLKKSLSVKQVFAIIILLLGVFATIFIFSNKGEPVFIPMVVEKIKSHKKADSIIANKDTTALGKLNNYIDSINISPYLKGGKWSFYLVEKDSAKSLAKINIDDGLVPASVMKIITTGTALATLGPKYRFTTYLEYDGEINLETKTLNGNIYIRGGGDPSLGSEAFGSSIEKVMNNWTDAIKKAGIDSINGSIIADVEAFDRDPIPNGWTWGDIQCDFGAGTCGLNIHDNVYEILFSASKDKVSIKTIPFIPGLKLYNQAINNPEVMKPYAYVQGGPFQYERTVFGEIINGYKERAAIPDPALFCAQSLMSSLLTIGVEIKDSCATTRILKLNKIKIASKKDRKIIVKTVSPPLEDIVYHTNQISQNFYAESILRAISYNETGYGSSYTSINTIYKFWKEKNVDLKGICMVDGSGLSRVNSVTAHQLVDMLLVLSKDSIISEVFFNSLPVAGETGTLKKTAAGTSAHGNVFAKGGSMSRVKSYAGFVNTKSGKQLCFAVLINSTLWSNEQLKEKIEKLFTLMAEL